VREKVEGGGEKRGMGGGVEWSERILKLRREMRGEHGV
jgi:hypothetical protein